MTSNLPAGVERAVRGICEDYARRKAEIEEGKLPPETIGHYMIINAKIDNAIASGGSEGMISMDQSILNLYKAGNITAQTALDFSQNPEQIKRRMGL